MDNKCHIFIVLFMPCLLDWQINNNCDVIQMYTSTVITFC